MIEITSFMGALLVPRLFQPTAGQHWSGAHLSADVSLRRIYKKHADSVWASVSLESQGNDGIQMQH
jgi:hypothetical protein